MKQLPMPMPTPTPTKEPRQKERGQASIVIGMFILTFLLFFAFVVNTGMLVNAKINLQNAADLAAYSGAATQARQLTLLSFINYEMRRQYKKFLFRYYILGTMFQDSFPGKHGATYTVGARSYVPGIDKVGSGAQAPPYPFPAVCVDLYSAPTNPSSPGSPTAQVGGQEAYCRIRELPQIAGSGQTSITGDAIQATLDQELNAIEGVREAACDNLSAINQALLFFWLFNTLPEGPVITGISNTNTFNANSLEIMYDRVKYLSSGLGLVPRELLLSFRAAVLQNYVNQPAATGVKGPQVDNWRSGTDAMKYERSINAFKSAYDTLGDTTWDANSVTMDELLPNGSGAPLPTPPGLASVNLLELKPINIDFTTFSVGYEQGANQGTASAPSYPCDQKLYPIPVHQLPVGFYKTQDFTTYYAVRVTANAKVLFSPWQTPLTLSAYAAAMPFGSRIGPQITDPQKFFTWPADTSFLTGGAIYKPNDPYFALKDIPSYIPNLPVQKTDADGGITGGWNNTQVQNAYYQWVPEFGNRQEYDALLNLAMVPNPWEESQYDIPNDIAAQGDPFVQWFDANGGAAFWAPLVDGPPGQFSTLLNNAMTAFFSATGNVGIGSGVSGKVTPPDLQTLLITAMGQYATRLQNHTQTEGLNNADTPPANAVTEGMYVMPMADPFQVPPGIYNTVSGTANAAPITVGSTSPPIPIKVSGIGSILPPGGAPSVSPTIFMVDQLTQYATVRDSWNAVQDSNFVNRGRVGYSVEFVSFDTISGFSNKPPTGDPDFSAILSSHTLKH